MTATLATLANANLCGTFTALAERLPTGRTCRFGSVRALATGLPVPAYNRVFAFAPATPEEVREAVTWLAGQGAPYWVNTDEATTEAVGDVAAALGLELAAFEVPGMVLRSLAGVAAPSPTLAVEAVTHQAAFDDFLTVAATVFHDTPQREMRRAYGAAWRAGDLQPFVGRVGGRAVACGVLSRTGDEAGVYAISVLPEQRRRGFGRAMTEAVLRAGRGSGCRRGVLQAAPGVRALYERMGFEAVVHYRHFSPAPAS